MLAFNEMPVVLVSVGTGGAAGVVLPLLLLEERVEWQPIVDEFPQSALVGFLEALQRYGNRTPQHRVAVRVTPL